MIKFIVMGTPVPQGSMVSLGRGRMKSDNPALKGWRDIVAMVAKGEAIKWEVKRQADKIFPLPKTTPLVVALHFYLAKNTPQRIAYRFPTVKPDVDKLTRAVFDALTGVLYEDDQQVVGVTAEKNFGEPERVEIEIFVRTEFGGDDEADSSATPNSTAKCAANLAGLRMTNKKPVDNAAIRDYTR
jgi:crossover junction endodeoxyribonuclease RusA